MNDQRTPDPDDGIVPTLKQTWDDAMPTPPDTSEWASEAIVRGRRRHRRATTALGAVTAVVVLVAVELGASSLMRGGGSSASVGDSAAVSSDPSTGMAEPMDPKSPAATDQPGTVNPVSQPGCPTDQKAWADSPSALTLPDGAISLRWCTWGGDQYLALWAPPEPLVEGVADFITTFNGLGKVDKDQSCTSDYSVPALAQLTYPDGSTRTVAGMAAGCGTIGGRIGFTTMEKKVVELYQAQRGPDFSPPAEKFTPCQPRVSVIEAEVRRVSQIFVCLEPPVNSVLVGKQMDDAAVAGIVADVEQNLREAGQVNYAEPRRHLFLYQANGEMLTLTQDKGATFWYTGGYHDKTLRVWTPSPASAAAIEAAASGSTSSSSPSSTQASPSRGSTQILPPTPKR